MNQPENVHGRPSASHWGKRAVGAYVAVAFLSMFLLLVGAVLLVAVLNPTVVFLPLLTIFLATVAAYLVGALQVRGWLVAGWSVLIRVGLAVLGAAAGLWTLASSPLPSDARVTFMGAAGIAAVNAVRRVGIAHRDNVRRDGPAGTAAVADRQELQPGIGS